METTQTTTAQFFLEYLNPKTKEWYPSAHGPFNSILEAEQHGSKIGSGFWDKSLARIQLVETVTTTSTATTTIAISPMSRNRHAKCRVCKATAWRPPEGEQYPTSLPPKPKSTNPSHPMEVWGKP